MCWTCFPVWFISTLLGFLFYKEQLSMRKKGTSIIFPACILQNNDRAFPGQFCMLSKGHLWSLSNPSSLTGTGKLAALCSSPAGMCRVVTFIRDRVGKEERKAAWGKAGVNTLLIGTALLSGTEDRQILGCPEAEGLPPAWHRQRKRVLGTWEAQPRAAQCCLRCSAGKMPQNSTECWS